MISASRGIKYGVSRNFRTWFMQVLYGAGEDGYLVVIERNTVEITATAQNAPLNMSVVSTWAIFWITPLTARGLCLGGDAVENRNLPVDLRRDVELVNFLFRQKVEKLTGFLFFRNYLS